MPEMSKTLPAFICLVFLIPCVAAACNDNTDQTSCEKKTGLLNRNYCNWYGEISTCQSNRWKRCKDYKELSECVSATSLRKEKACSWCIETQTCFKAGAWKCSLECCVSSALTSQCQESEADVKTYCYPHIDTQSLNVVLDFVGDGLTDLQKRFVEKQRNDVLCFLKGAVGKGNYEITIKVEAVDIDGVGGTLGRAGPKEILNDPLNGYVRVLEGRMAFDTADLAAMEAKGNLPDVILHEMLHALGMGSLWAQNGCVEKDSGCVGPTYWNPETCPKAHEAYQSMGGEGVIPIEDLGGAGTACSHWKESVFKDEIGTGYVAYGAPLSTMTVQSLADIGYVVDPLCPVVKQGKFINIPGARTRSAQGTSEAYSASMTAMPFTTVERSAEWWAERDEIKSFEVDTSSTNPPDQDQDQDQDGTRSVNPPTISPRQDISGSMASPLALACIMFPILGFLV